MPLLIQVYAPGAWLAEGTDGGQNGVWWIDRSPATDTFPLPASLMCRSHLKNDLSPNFKAHLVQAQRPAKGIGFCGKTLSRNSCHSPLTE